ncbi:MAG: hypothetical protein QT04_C0061G0018 [archaeon GW2011_AR11]|nr:MAG: hypothetical protein QT04_C0061G0018 [archaeon GW2011_AR11]
MGKDFSHQYLIPAAFFTLPPKLLDKIRSIFLGFILLWQLNTSKNNFLSSGHV